MESGAPHTGVHGVSYGISVFLDATRWRYPLVSGSAWKNMQAASAHLLRRPRHAGMQGCRSVGMDAGASWGLVPCGDQGLLVSVASTRGRPSIFAEWTGIHRRRDTFVSIDDLQNARVHRGGTDAHLGCVVTSPSTAHCRGGARVETDMPEQIRDAIASLQVVESQVKRLLKSARERRIFFGLTYDYVDEDIAQILGRLRYMQHVVEYKASVVSHVSRPSADSTSNRHRI